MTNTHGTHAVAITKERQLILDFNMFSEIITFEKKGEYGRKNIKIRMLKLE